MSIKSTGKSPAFILKSSTAHRLAIDPMAQSRYAAQKYRVDLIENKVAHLQEGLSETGKRLQFELQKAVFVDQEIEAMVKLLDQMREDRKAHLRKPKVLSKDLETIQNRKKHLVQSLNETVGKNSLAREMIKDLRKERAMMDSTYTTISL